mgnify:CR=1 FL=1
MGMKVYAANQQSRAVSINPKNGHVAVGINNGEINIYKSTKNMELTKTIKVLQDSIDCLRYSPDGTKLAVGCQDTCLYIFTVNYPRVFLRN